LENGGGGIKDIAAITLPPDLVQQAIFDTGHAVGRLAQQRYAGGQLVAFDYRHTKEAAPTVALKAAGHVLEYYHGRLPVCPQNSENADSASLS